MSGLTISEVGRRVGLRPSTIRYYEHIGILPAAFRVNGKRRYDKSVLHQLMVIQRARETGFALEEIRKLFFGFGTSTPPSKRWLEMSQRKLAELEAQSQRIQTMRELLRRMQTCRCGSLDECGRKLLMHTCS
jgi:DNA-binding transcriptional MerR regulator